MDGNAKISWPQLRMRMTVNASFAHGFRILRYTGRKSQWLVTDCGTDHYANTSMQYTAIFHGGKNVNFQMIFSFIFFSFLFKNLWWYTLHVDPPH